MVYHGRLKESLGTPGGSFFYIIQSNPSKPRIFMKRSLQSPSPLLKNQKKSIGSLLSSLGNSPPLSCISDLWPCHFLTITITRPLFFFFSLYTFKASGKNWTRKGKRDDQFPFSPHLFSFLSNPSPDFFFLLVHEYSPYDLIKLEPEVSICIMNFLFFFLCKIYITYILLPYARTIPITLHFSLTHTLLTQPFVFVLSLSDRFPFLSTYLFILFSCVLFRDILYK